MPLNEAGYKCFENVLKELNDIFSESNVNNSKLEKIVKRLIERRKHLTAYLKLFNACQWLKIQPQLRQSLNETMLKRLVDFKDLILQTVETTDLDTNTMKYVELHLLGIRCHYKLVRDEMQTLADLNVKLKKWLEKKTLHKIGELLERGIIDKTPEQIIYLKNGQTVELEKKTEVVKEFYYYFINNCFLLRAETERNLNDVEYRKRLQDLQTKLLKKQPNDIKHYFTSLAKNTNQPNNLENFGYTQEILMESFCKDHVVQTFASNNSKYFIDEFVAIFRNKEFWENKFWKKFFEYFSYIIFNFNGTAFEEILKILIKNENNEKIFIDKRYILIDQIYNCLVDLYRSYIEHIQNQPTADGDKSTKFRNELYKSGCQLLHKHLESLLKMLNNLDYLKVLRDQVINEKNAGATIKMLQDSPAYGSCIRELDFKLEPQDVRYFFSSQFFRLVINGDLIDVYRFGTFIPLIFYIYAFDIEQKNSSILDLTKLRGFFNESQLFKQQKEFEKGLNDLTEFMQVLVKMGSLQSRWECANYVLEELRKQCSVHSEEMQADDESNELIDKDDVIKVKILEYFHSKNGEVDKKKLMLRLAETLNIHLFKHVIKDRSKLIDFLVKHNANFKHHRTFNVDKDMVPGFGIPYYLTATEKPQNIDSDDNSFDCDIMNAIVFRVFTCDSSSDKKEFLINKKSYSDEFNELKKTLWNLKKFYDQKEDPVDNVGNQTDVSELYMQYYAHLKKLSFESIADGFKGDYHESLTNRKLYADKIVKNFLNYDLEHIKTIIRSTSSDEMEKSNLITMLSGLMKRDMRSLHQWIDSTSSIGQNINMQHFYYKYSQDDFDQWFREQNPNVMQTTIDQDQLNSERKNTIKSFREFKKSLGSFKINDLQHNQAGALALISKQLTKNKNANIFMKIGTGQGKSLIIAETVRKLFKINNKAATKVFVFTCYDHLAKRDHKNFVDFYTAANINSIYCSRSSLLSEVMQNDVIYSELDEFFNMLRREFSNSLINGQPIKYPDFENAILVLDEFDSLVLDSEDFSQRINYFDVRSKSQRTAELPVNKNDLEQYFGGSDFMKACNQSLDGLFTKWYDSTKTQYDAIKRDSKNSNAKIKIDNLGKEHSYVGNFLDYLAKNGRAEMLAIILYPTAFFKQFKQVIGFSGSVEGKDTGRFNSLFDTSLFYDIPPFFGKKRNNENRKQVKNLIVHEQSQFIDEIMQDLKERCLSQPVLIFAETELQSNEQTKPDFQLIKETLIKEKETDAHLSQCQLLYIEKEDDIDANLNLIGYAKTITIASRVIARGADILVYKDVKDGLHLLITYYPMHKNIFVQMLGRTARQDQLGTYSIIAKSEIKYDELKVDQIKINTRMVTWHNLSVWFYKELARNQQTSTILSDNKRLRWPFLLTMMFSIGIDKSFEVLKDFVTKYILK